MKSNFWLLHILKPNYGLLFLTMCLLFNNKTIDSSMAQYRGYYEIPEGTVIKLRMDRTLNSSSVRVGDQFTATVFEPVINRNKVLISQGAKIEGHVIQVERAQRNRSGTMEVNFDRLILSNGKDLSLDGYLTSLDPTERSQIDSEGRTTGSSNTKRKVIFIGGGAGLGAAIGAMAGGGKGAAIGSGVGAAAGILGALLNKGDEAQVKAGQKFGLQLTRSIRFAETDILDNGRQDNYSDTRLIRVIEAKAIRQSNNTIKTEILTEVNSEGWDIYGDYKIERDKVEIWVRGTPPYRYSSQITTRKRIEVVTYEDTSRINQVLIHGENRDFTVSIQNNFSVSSRDRTFLSRKLKTQADNILNKFRLQIHDSRRGNSWQISENESALYATLNMLPPVTQFYAELIETNSPDAAQRGALDILMRGTKRISNLLKNIGRSGDKIREDFYNFEADVDQMAATYGINFVTD